MIHPLAEVQTKNIGEGTRIWQFSVVLEGAVIGRDCNINSHTFIENEVVVGDRVTLKSGAYLWDGIELQDDVFVGPNVTFTNDRYPRSKQYPESFQKTLVKRKASIGAAAVVLGGTVIGEYALIAAGAVVTRDVPNRAMVMGNPARITGWVNIDGSKMIPENGGYRDNEQRMWMVIDQNLVMI
nr:acyltransferase [Pedobacter sp. ASV19]